MQKLLNGIHKFRNNVFRRQRELFTRLKGGQQPIAMFITCSDSRICPNLMTQTQPGELFVLRIAGNIIPPYGAVKGGEAATIEYAVSILKIRDIVVCGHSNCGAMTSLLDGRGLDEVPAVRDYLHNAEATRRIVLQNYPGVTDFEERLNLAVELNVLSQLEHLRTHPSVAAAVARDELNLHGWVYRFESGQVFAYSDERDRFVPVEEVEADSAILQPVQ